MKKLFFVLFIIIITAIVCVIYFPGLHYRFQTKHNNFIIYSNRTVTPELISILDSAYLPLKRSELWRHDLRLKICLNEGSFYPGIISYIFGDAFAWGFYDRVVINGEIRPGNKVLYRDYMWNLKELLTHEMVHCLQFDYYGVMNSRPVAQVPEWQWEGYAEYIARKAGDTTNLKEAVQNFELKLRYGPEEWAAMMPDHTIIPRQYRLYYYLVRYEKEVLHKSLPRMIESQEPVEARIRELFTWAGNPY